MNWVGCKFEGDGMFFKDFEIEVCLGKGRVSNVENLRVLF